MTADTHTSCPFQNAPSGVAGAPARLQALAAGALDEAEARPLLQHLGLDCPHCEELWASEETAALLAGLADRVEERLPAPRPGELDAIYRRFEEQAGLAGAAADADAAGSWRARLVRWLRPLALAAVPVVLLLVVLLPRLGGGPDPRAPGGEAVPWRDKGMAAPGGGPAQADPLRLVLFHGRADGGAGGAPAVLGPVTGPLRPGDAVLFRLQLGQAGPVVLSVTGPDGQTEELWKQTYPAGEHELARAGQALAYGVERAGTYRFVLVQGTSRSTAAAVVTP